MDDEKQETANMFGEEISPEEMKIINFINSRELFYESENRPKILAEVKEKFGDTGCEVLKQLSEDTKIDLDEHCESCEESAKKASEDIKNKLKFVEIFLDSELEEAAQEVSDNEEIQETMLTDTDVKKSIVKFTAYDIDNVPDDVLERTKIKILFLGITDGWLLDEYFAGQ